MADDFYRRASAVEACLCRSRRPLVKGLNDDWLMFLSPALCFRASLRVHDRGGRPMNPQFILVVAIGGAIGSVVRYLVAIGVGRVFGVNFPWGTLIINVTGSFLIGAFASLFALKWDLPQAMRIFLTVGICGGYTTFSTFSLDAFYLMERGELAAAGFYVIASVVLSIAALVAAMQLVRLM
jgi:fluoride exporter